MPPIPPIKISFGVFLNFVAAEHLAKITRVREAMRPYTPGSDFWKAGRAAIQRAAATGDLSRLDRCLTGLKDLKKPSPYDAAFTGFRRWYNRTKPTWLGEPIPKRWTRDRLTVNLRPEMRLEIDGKAYVVKLFLRKGDRLTKRRIETALRLLQISYPDDNVAVLDVRYGKLHTGPTKRLDDLDVFLEAEASSFVLMWDGLQARKAS